MLRIRAMDMPRNCANKKNVGPGCADMLQPCLCDFEMATANDLHAACLHYFYMCTDNARPRSMN